MRQNKNMKKSWDPLDLSHEKKHLDLKYLLGGEEDPAKGLAPSKTFVKL